jgi:hypothetical protein
MLSNPLIDKIIAPVLPRKKYEKIWASFVISKQLPKVNSHPRGEKSPILVTQFGAHICKYFFLTTCPVNKANPEFAKSDPKTPKAKKEPIETTSLCCHLDFLGLIV